MNPSKAKRFRQELERRLSVALEWYQGCDPVPETLQNIRADVKDVFRSLKKEYGINNPPFDLAAFFDDDNYIVVKVVTEEQN